MHPPEFFSLGPKRAKEFLEKASRRELERMVGGKLKAMRGVRRGNDERAQEDRKFC